MSLESQIQNISEQQSSFLPYILDYIPDEIQRRAKTELHEDEETRISSLALLRELLKKEEGIEIPDEDIVLLAFLRTGKFDVKRALTLIKNSFSLLRKRSELFYNFDFNDVRKMLETEALGVLPYRDREGCVILLIRVQKWNPPTDTLGDVLRALTAILIHSSLCSTTQIAGYKVIFDYEGFKLHHVIHIVPTYVWMLGEAFQGHFPARFKAVYMVNVNHFVSHLWAIFKKCLTKKLQARCHFFGNNETNKKLHHFLDRSILPAEYGGLLPPFVDVNQEWVKNIVECRDRITELLSYGYWKSRPVKPEELKKIKKEMKFIKLK